MSAESPQPRVYVACLSCYASHSRLVGIWLPAVEAEDVTLQQVHRDMPAGPRADCCEIEVHDTDEMPVSREMSVSEAARWGRLVAECDEHLRGAFYAWVENEGLTEPPEDLESFVESYAGSYDDSEDFARHWAEETDMMDRWPDDAQTYFAWDRFARDMVLGGDVSVVRDPEGGVFVFWSR